MFLHVLYQKAIRRLRYIVKNIHSTMLHIRNVRQKLLKIHKRSPRSGNPAAVYSRVCFQLVHKRGAFVVHTEPVVAAILSFRGLHGSIEYIQKMVEVS